MRVTHHAPQFGAVVEDGNVVTDSKVKKRFVQPIGMMTGLPPMTCSTTAPSHPSPFTRCFVPHFLSSS